jgi:hypothetical protein
LQLGRFAAAVFVVPPVPVALDGLEPLFRPVEVEPDAPPVPEVPAEPADPSVEPLEPEPPDPEPLPAEPTVEPLPDEPDPLPELEPKPALLPLDPDPELDPELFIALFSWMLPLASRQCVVGETFGVEVAPDEPLIEPDEPEPD